MAPARMVSFIEAHAAECPVCQDDPDLQAEIEKITEIVLPESKIPKAVRLQQEQDDIDSSDEYDEEETDTSDDDDDDDSDDDPLDEEPSEDENFDEDELDTDI